MLRLHPSLARAIVLAFGLAMLLPGCKKDPNHEAKSGGAPAAMGAMNAMATMGRMEGVGAMDRPAAPRPDAPTSAVKDEDLQKALTKKLGPKLQSEMDEVKKKLADAKQAFDVSESGKQVYQQLGQVVETLKVIGAEARHGRFERVSALAMSGYVMGIMALYQLKDVAVDLAKKAVAAGKKLKLGAAKKLGEQAKALGTLAKALATVQVKYTETIRELLASKSPKLRLSTFRSLARGYDKAPDLGKKLIRKLLEAGVEAEKDAAVKAKMEAILKGLR